METKIKIMISLGSSYAAGCIPCFDHYYEMAREENISDEDISRIVAIAKKVRKGSDIALEKAISDILEGEEAVFKMDGESCGCGCT